MKKLYLLPLLCFLTLASCKDDKELPVPQPEPEVPVPGEPDPETEAKEVAFSFRYDPRPEGIEDFELILSLNDSIILLDTLIAARTHHNLVVKSDKTKFDVTTVYSDPATGKYTMKTYVQVNPNNWHVKDYRTRTVQGETQVSTVHYSNVTDIKRHRFSSEGTNRYEGDFHRDNLTMKYDRLLPSDLTYLLLPNTGKYIFAEAGTEETHVDFSEAITAERHMFNKPPGVDAITAFLWGYAKAGDYSKQLLLYAHTSMPGDDYNLLYPSTVIEEFELGLSYDDAEGSRHSYGYAGTTVPTEVDMLAKADFTVTRAEFDNFGIEFEEDGPMSYEMMWEPRESDLNAQWYVYLSPEETTFNAKEFLGNLGAELLEGKDTTRFSLSFISSMKAEGYTFQSYHDYLNNQEAYLRKEMRQYRLISKRFR
ncbi:hypothetical protein GCM10023188_18820 [Pontibacter saemangeumensis]|uniref:Uncharacterized protein n=1 Tax=Pontibacter saemangeumensis TaxID=1084525 RepID=A0ABP8LLY8_9BACT